MAECVPCLFLGWHKLETLTQQVLRLTSVLWNEVEGLAAEVKQLCLLLLVLDYKMFGQVSRIDLLISIGFVSNSVVHASRHVFIYFVLSLPK